MQYQEGLLTWGRNSKWGSYDEVRGSFEEEDQLQKHFLNKTLSKKITKKSIPKKEKASPPPTKDGTEGNAGEAS